MWAATGAAVFDVLAPYFSNLTIVELYIDDALTFDVERLAEVLMPACSSGGTA